MLSQLISRVLILSLGTLYPAYSSYKAVRTKNVREYVKWMMYWVVFAFFTTAETFGDIFLSWVPLYYELKICFLVWMLAPATKGSSILYRKFVHPYLSKNEKEIDDAIARASQEGVGMLRRAGQRGLQAVASGVVQSNVMTMSQVYFQQQIQQIIPAATAQQDHVQHEQLLGQQQEQQPEQQQQQQQQQQQLFQQASTLSLSSSTSSYSSSTAVVAEEPEVADQPPPYTASSGSSSHAVKAEPVLDDGAGSSAAFVPLTPPLHRSRPAAAATANAASAGAATRRTNKAATATARASSTSAKGRTRTANQTRKANP